VSWLGRLADPNFLNVLLWIPAHSGPTRFKIVAGLTLASIATFGVASKVRDRIRPRLIGFELALTVSAALNILDRWDERRKRLARIAAIIDFFSIPALTLLIADLCFWAALSVPFEVPWLKGVGVLMGWAALAVLPIGWAEDVAMLRSLSSSPGSKSVYVTRLFASFKYGILAIATAFLLCRFEYFVYQLIEPAVRLYPRSTLALLAAVSAGFGLWMLQLAKPLHPSLLMLHLAPSREAANRVLNRWGAKRQMAQRANLVDTVFAILSTVTLAFLFFRLAGPPENAPILASVSQSVGWFMLLAGTCHVAQNVGAEAALREKKMGWWISICRTCGGLRVSLFFLGGLWGGFLWLRWEGAFVARLLRAIQTTAGAGR
jgi:hypothetical protein